MNCFKVFVQVLFGVISVLLLLICQMSFLVVLDSKSTVSGAAWCLEIILVLTVPEVLIVLKGIWSASFLANGRYKQWPLLGPFLLGMIFSLAEGAVTTFLVLRILPLIPKYLIPLLFNGCFIAQLLFKFRRKSSNGESSICERFLWLCLLTIYITGLCGLGVVLSQEESMTSFHSVVLVLSLVLLSLLWFGPLKTYTQGRTSAEKQNSKIIYPVLKVISTLITVYKILEYENQAFTLLDINFSKLLSDLKELKDSNYIWYLLVHILSGIILQFHNFMFPRRFSSCLTSLLPCIVSPIIACGTYLLLCFSNDIIAMAPHKTSCHIHVTSESWHLYAVMIAIYLIPSVDIIFTSWKIYKKSTVNFVKMSKSNGIFNTMFIAQTLLLRSYVEIESIMKQPEEGKTNRRSRIFICTTMYQEAQHEMDRLLKSLCKISDSNKIKEEDIYIESHIFLDNGANGVEIKDFGVQLLALIEDNLEFCKEPGTILQTPYGIQLAWERNPEMSLFIHLKDCNKVKAKKRWSQVMYFNYILKYRSKVIGNGLIYKPVFKSKSAYSLFQNVTESLDLEIDLNMFNTDSEGNKEHNLTIESNNDSGMRTLQVPKVIFGNPSDTSSEHSILSNGYESESGIQTGSDIEENFLLKTDTTSLDIESNVSGFGGQSQNISRWSSINNIPSISASVAANAELWNRDDDVPSYILSTDADMSFDDECVLDLYRTIDADPDIGGVCGRTFPIGVHKHPIVWLQMFDYAKDFWMVKSAQNIIGSVMCCPGCLSLYRFKALEDVMQTYSESTQTMEDVFTKDSGEDRWMCTLMMLKGWELRYTNHGKNTTYCPEDTLEFMKQRRRWLLSDFANAAVVLRNMRNLMAKNNAFTMVYVVYLLQLFIIMALYPGSTIIMLSLGLELASGLPLVIAAPIMAFVPGFYCFMLLYKVRPDIEVTVTKLLIFGLGVVTLYIFAATSIIVVQDLYKDFHNNNLDHIQDVIILAFIGSYFYAALFHPRESWILVCGLPYLFYLPLLNLILPLYAVCNVVDQTWGTRDGQKAKLPKVLRFPKFGRKKKKLVKSLSGKASSYASLSSSAPDLTEYNETETEFWTNLVETLIGKDVNISMSVEDRDTGLHKLRRKALAVFLISNGVWMTILCVFYVSLFYLLSVDSKTTYGIVMASLMGLSPIIQFCGMTVYRLHDGLYNLGKILSS